MKCKTAFLSLFCFAHLCSSFVESSFAVTTLEDSKLFNERSGYKVRSISTIDEVPVGSIMPWPSSGTPIPYSWLPCDGRSITMSAFSRMPEQWIRDKWFRHAQEVIGSVTPNYNSSTRTPSREGVFLRGKFKAGNYNTEYDDMFRSHTHEQPKHTHPITLNVEDGRASGKFDPQEYTDFYARRADYNRSLVEYNPSASFQKHLNDLGGIGRLQSIEMVGNTLSQLVFPIDKLPTKTLYEGGTGFCTYDGYYGRYYGSHSLDYGSVEVPSRKINDTFSTLSMDSSGRNVLGMTILDGQNTLTVEGEYEGTMDDPTIMGEILPSGGDTSYTNQNVHENGETRNEKETTPVNTEVMYIIKIHP